MSSRHPTELAVDVLDPQVELEIPLEHAAELLEGGGYELARGMYRGEHWRRERGRGCYHLRIRGDRAWLHRDRWDPRRYPIRHGLETPELTAAFPLASAAVVAAGLGAVRLVRRVL